MDEELAWDRSLRMPDGIVYLSSRWSSPQIQAEAEGMEMER
jgi:hypothetical protein